MNQRFITAMIFLLSMVFTDDPAEARPDVRQMTCKSAADLVKKRGALAMTTGKNRYERIVAKPSSCDSRRRFQAKTKDNPSCFIGYKCSSSMGGR
ncbi:MAG: hypothetical protein GY742_06795 [Hyphomicrobiales bacterium]|nr:hypothetical protein [Hyphomicrobiales bacterium]